MMGYKVGTALVKRNFISYIYLYRNSISPLEKHSCETDNTEKQEFILQHDNSNKLQITLRIKRGRVKINYGSSMLWNIIQQLKRWSRSICNDMKRSSCFQVKKLHINTQIFKNPHNYVPYAYVYIHQCIEIGIKNYNPNQ